jgi:hypothetical protein
MDAQYAGGARKHVHCTLSKSKITFPSSTTISAMGAVLAWKHVREE